MIRFFEFPARTRSDELKLIHSKQDTIIKHMIALYFGTDDEIGRNKWDKEIIDRFWEFVDKLHWGISEYDFVGHIFPYPASRQFKTEYIKCQRWIEKHLGRRISDYNSKCQEVFEYIHPRIVKFVRYTKTFIPNEAPTESEFRTNFQKLF